MKYYQFKVYLNGQGETPREAWKDAVNAILERPAILDPCPSEADTTLLHKEEDER